MTFQKSERRKRALQRIERQIALGTKPKKRTHPWHRISEPLLASDLDRLHREGDTLALRIAGHA